MRLLLIIFLLFPFYLSAEETLTGDYETDIVNLKDELRRLRKDQDADTLNDQEASYYNNISNSTITGEVSGDIQYFDGSNWNRLPKGTTGQILKTGTPPSWVTPVQMKTGTYTGNGAATQAITGIGFQVATLIVYPESGTIRILHKATPDGANALITNNAGSTYYTTDDVISLDADGFTVGDGSTQGINLFNIHAIVYTYISATY